ncbi:MAG: hypothetical protein MUC80_05125 [Candidatus Thermoplasmatota archaeon]|jgi:hypothetical protein|nr:hypothetical protein [Candidatus Thermoplasmatota archaeon]
MGRFLYPVPVIPRDDAYQGHIKNIDFELWHFEAICDNDYSLLVGIMIYRLRKSGIVKTRLGIYKNGKAELISNKTFLLSDVVLSDEFLSIKLGQWLQIHFDQEHFNRTGEWIIDLSINDHDCSVKLKFLGITNGWKTKTEYTCWAAILPKAVVDGLLILKNQKISLKGKGYHDHNWEQSFAILQKKHGWFCGTIYADSLKITWAKETSNSTEGEVVIVNQDTNKFNKNKGFYVIPPKDVTFTLTDVIRKDGHRIPSEIKLIIRSTIEENIPFSAEISMRINDLQEMRFFTTKYYVCQVKATGVLKLGTTEEHLQNSSQIIEFPSYLGKK